MKRKRFILENGMEVVVRDSRDLHKLCKSSMLFFRKGEPFLPVLLGKTLNLRLKK